MNAHWHYQETAPFFQQGRDHARNNFSREERSSLAILIRETLQNALDARKDGNNDAVRVLIRNRSGDFDSQYLSDLIDQTFRTHLEASGAPPLCEANQASVLTIEDFGTNGLLGDFLNSNTDGPGENWNAFWHREGEGAKSKSSNGGAGQGKVTYFKHSAAGVVFALTKRSSDNRRLLMGKGSFLRDYVCGDKKYYRATFWTTSDKAPIPEDDPKFLDAFSKAFGLSRTAEDSGLSLVIPYAGEFNVKEGIQSVILDFYLPIASKRLAVQVGNTLIDSESIDQIASNMLTDATVLEKHSSFTTAYRRFARHILHSPPAMVSLKEGWSKQVTIPEDAFSEGALEAIRGSLSKGEIIGIRLPMNVKKKDSPPASTYFDVFLQLPDELPFNEEAFVRQDLLIGGESHIASSAFVQKARSLTWIQSQELSEFLLSAEEPTHLKWNASLARDKGLYSNPEPVLRAIRQAVPRLLAILLKGSIEKDVKSLARFFSKPASEEANRRGQANRHTNDPTGTEPPKSPPDPSLKPFRIEGVGTKIRVMPRTSKSLEQAKLPMRAVLELAYEGLGQNAFADYDPFDFDLSDAQYPARGTGISVNSKALNRLEFTINESNFLLEVSGFSPHMRVRARLHTSEDSGENALSAEE